MARRSTFAISFLWMLLHVIGKSGVVSQSAMQCCSPSSMCKVARGIFDLPNVSPDYNFVTEMPAGACNISVYQLQKTRNYIALKTPGDEFILNGNRTIAVTGDINGSGTVFHYDREYIEEVTSPGPLTDAVQIMLLAQEINLGLRYEYYYPIKTTKTENTTKNLPSATVTSVAPRTREANQHHIRHSNSNKNVHFAVRPPYEKMEQRRNATHRNGRGGRYSWHLNGYSQCSKSCAEGVQTPIMVCKRANKNIVVADVRCAGVPKPTAEPRACNKRPCPPDWVVSDWSHCSVTCGLGVQTRHLTCKQQLTSTYQISVALSLCPAARPPTVKTCNDGQPPCRLGHWETGSWSECSSNCGPGKKERAVYCSAGNDCDPADRPPSETDCDSPCKSTGMWVYTPWLNQCSESCGEGIQIRSVHCFGGECDPNTMPETERGCASQELCSGQWFSGPWQDCTGICDVGRQTRRVICLRTEHGVTKQAPDSFCLTAKKPSSSKSCHLSACRPTWYTSDYSECSQSCNGGIMSRKVVCLDHDNQVASCNDTYEPRRATICNHNACPDLLEKEPNEIPDQSQSDNYLKKESTADDPGTDSNQSTRNTHKSGNAYHQIDVPFDDGDNYYNADCADKLTTCHIALQARMCTYNYYRENCCRSCQNGRKHYIIE